MTEKGNTMRDLLHAAFDGLSDNIKAAVDTVSVVTLLGTLVQVLPTIASLLTVIWSALRVYEMDTVQRWLRGRKTPAIDDASADKREP